MKVSVAVVAVVAAALLLFSAGATHVYGTDRQAQTASPWWPDGAAGDTFWDSSLIDVPGLSVYSVHCHGQMRLDIQVGATGPWHSNPCYAALGVYDTADGSGSEYGLYLMLPGGRTAVYRSSTNGGPWTYYTSDVVYFDSPPGS